jgi:uncharacterized membrane protein
VAHRGVVYREPVNSAALGAVFLVGGSVALAAGLFDMLAPARAIRWQVRSTARHGGSRRAVGTGFQKALGIDPDSDPWNDAHAKRMVRWLGLCLSLVSLVFVFVGVWMRAAD